MSLWETGVEIMNSKGRPTTSCIVRAELEQPPARDSCRFRVPVLCAEVGAGSEVIRAYLINRDSSGFWEASMFHYPPLLHN